PRERLVLIGKDRRIADVAAGAAALNADRHAAGRTLPAELGLILVGGHAGPRGPGAYAPVGKESAHGGGGCDRNAGRAEPRNLRLRLEYALIVARLHVAEHMPLRPTRVGMPGGDVARIVGTAVDARPAQLLLGAGGLSGLAGEFSRSHAVTGAP